MAFLCNCRRLNQFMWVLDERMVPIFLEFQSAEIQRSEEYLMEQINLAQLLSYCHQEHEWYNNNICFRANLLRFWR